MQQSLDYVGIIRQAKVANSFTFSTMSWSGISLNFCYIDPIARSTQNIIRDKKTPSWVHHDLMHLHQRTWPVSIRHYNLHVYNCIHTNILTLILLQGSNFLLCASLTASVRTCCRRISILNSGSSTTFLFKAITDLPNWLRIQIRGCLVEWSHIVIVLPMCAHITGILQTALNSHLIFNTINLHYHQV